MCLKNNHLLKIKINLGICSFREGESRFTTLLGPCLFCAFPTLLLPAYSPHQVWQAHDHEVTLHMLKLEPAAQIGCPDCLRYRSSSLQD
jgi:hypothetical protein